MRRLQLFAAGTFALVATMGILGACGDDDTPFLPVDSDAGDGSSRDGNQQQPDGRTNPPDGNVTETGGGDSSTQDATPDPDGGTADADAGEITDAAVFDANDPDGFVTTFDAGADAGFQPDAAPVQLAEVFCQTLTRCCFNDPNLGQGGAIPGGGTYNKQKCLDTYAVNGFEQGVPGPKANPDRILLSQTKSAECADKLKNLSCSLGFAEFAAVREACYGALPGKQAEGQDCNTSSECRDGFFCNTPDGGPTGKCEAVRPTGGQCGDFTSDPATSQNACSYRYSGDPARYCEWYDTVADNILPRAQWVCKDARANNSLCLNSAWCGAGICNAPTARCLPTITYFPPTACNQYKQ